MSAIRIQGNQKAWSAFIMALLATIMGQYGVGEAPPPTDLIEAGQAIIVPLANSIIAYAVTWFVSNR